MYIHGFYVLRGVEGGGGDSQSHAIIVSWGLRIGGIYVSVCKFSTPLLSQKRSYIKKSWRYFVNSNILRHDVIPKYIPSLSGKFMFRKLWRVIDPIFE